MPIGLAAVASLARLPCQDKNFILRYIVCYSIGRSTSHPEKAALKLPTVLFHFANKPHLCTQDLCAWLEGRGLYIYMLDSYVAPARVSVYPQLRYWKKLKEQDCLTVVSNVS